MLDDIRGPRPWLSLDKAPVASWGTRENIGQRDRVVRHNFSFSTTLKGASPHARTNRQNVVCSTQLPALATDCAGRNGGNFRWV